MTAITVGTSVTTTDADDVTIDVLQAIEDGNLDQQLADVITACERRKRLLEPWDGIGILLRMREEMTMLLSSSSCNEQRKACLGTEINDAIKHVLAEYGHNALVVPLANMLRRDMLVKLVGLKPDAAAVAADGRP